MINLFSPLFFIFSGYLDSLLISCYFLWFGFQLVQELNYSYQTSVYLIASPLALLLISICLSCLPGPPSAPPSSISSSLSAGSARQRRRNRPCWPPRPSCTYLCPPLHPTFIYLQHWYYLSLHLEAAIGISISQTVSKIALSQSLTQMSGRCKMSSRIQTGFEVLV